MSAQRVAKTAMIGSLTQLIGEMGLDLQQINLRRGMRSSSGILLEEIAPSATTTRSGAWVSR